MSLISRKGQMIRHFVLSTRAFPKPLVAMNTMPLSTFSSSPLVFGRSMNSSFQPYSPIISQLHSSFYAKPSSARFFSTTPPTDGNNSSATASDAEAVSSKTNSERTDVAKVDFDEYDDYEEPKNAKEWVKMYTVLFTRLALLLAGLACASYTVYWLIPGRLSPNNIFSEVFEMLRYKDEIQKVLGEDIKARHSINGRVRHIAQYVYVAEDGSNRTRIRFFMKGSRGLITVWAEVSDNMNANEYVYIICQNNRTGRVHTVVDNREELQLQHLKAQKESGLQKRLEYFAK